MERNTRHAMELRNFRFKLPTMPEPRQRKRKMSEEITGDVLSARSARLENRLKRMEETRDLPSPMQRKRMEKREAEIRKRRDVIDIEKEDSAFVSTRTFSRQLLLAVLKRNEEKVKKLMRDPRGVLMPVNAATTQYSYVDDRTPIVEAFASENHSLLMTLLIERAEKNVKGIDVNLLEPLYCNSNYGSFFFPTVPSDDSLALRKYSAPEKLQEPLVVQLVRRGVPYSIIEKFRPVSLYLRKKLELNDGVNDIVKKAHALIGASEGEFYTTDDYGRAAVAALRYGHCILALNLARTNKMFNPLMEEILAEPYSSEPFDSDGFMYKRSHTTPYILPIHTAAARGRSDVLQWYYSVYANALNLKDEDHWTPLHYAAVAEDPRALKWILAKGAQLTFRNKQGQTALHVAVQAGRVENVKIITSSLEALDRLCLNSDHLSLEHRSSVNWKNGEGMSALHLAVSIGNVEIVEALCRHPYIDLDSRNKDGITAFMVAASRGHLSCVQFLSKTCIGQVDELERSALSYAAINGQTNIVAYLLKSTEINHESVDICHNSALHYACAYGWLPIVKLLVQVDPTLLGGLNRKELTPAVCAFRNGNFGIITWLLASGFVKYIGADPCSKEQLKLHSKHSSDLQKAIESIESWTAQWNMTLSAPKCAVLHLGRLKTRSKYVLNGCIISPKNEIRDLGVFFNSKLHFEHHIDQITRKARSMCNLMLRSFLTTSSDVLLKAYKIYIRPLLESSTVIWNPTAIGLVNKLESVQREFTRRLFWRSHLSQSSYPQRLEHFKLETLEYRRALNDMYFLFDSAHGFVHLDTSNIYSIAPLSRTLRSSHRLRLTIPFLMPSSLSSVATRPLTLWNSLSNPIVTLPRIPYRNHIRRTPSLVLPVSQIKL
ncbi:hypothetical protein PRIPAC_74497 [Pristionchus pacificus]|uniref:Ankyrin repeat-containing protein n=1 Tax=Pristionchus pacificus TaxID=54126 RepID=A0A2A6BFP6_PRIPA|nr:hypothetical protein PRIPAC_74497 [Pristionchus pacificus]|eukprot:PDM64686.1 Ankyrin repeat-containing protein [Pristionchus pacificus]